MGKSGRGFKSEAISMSIGYKDKDNKFHPIKQYHGVRKSRDKHAKTKGVKIRKKSEPFKVSKTDGATKQQLIQMQRADVGRRALDFGMSEKEMMEWERIAGSKIVKVKHEMMNGKPVTTVRFANGEEWFEFERFDHQEQFIRENKIEIDHKRVGEFVEIDHPMIAGYYTMTSGKIAFGEREDRMKRDEEQLVDLNRIRELESIEDPTHEKEMELKKLYKQADKEELEGLDLDTKKRLVTTYPYRDNAKKLSMLDYHELPDQLKDDLSDLHYPDGRMTFTDIVTEWNEMTEHEKLEFLKGIRDQS